jgi:hypothetical protein
VLGFTAEYVNRIPLYGVGYPILCVLPAVMREQPLNIFGDDVDFEVHLRSDRCAAQGGRFPGRRDQRDLKPLSRACVFMSPPEAS